MHYTHFTQRTNRFPFSDKKSTPDKHPGLTLFLESQVKESNAVHLGKEVLGFVPGAVADVEAHDTVLHSGTVFSKDKGNSVFYLLVRFDIGGAEVLIFVDDLVN